MAEDKNYHRPLGIDLKKQMDAACIGDDDGDGNIAAGNPQFFTEYQLTSKSAAKKPRKYKSKRPDKYMWVRKDGTTADVSCLTEEEAKIAVCDLIDLVEKIQGSHMEMSDLFEKYGFAR